MAIDPPKPLSPDALRPHWEPEDVPFETTASVEPGEQSLGQSRALDALSFGVGVRSEGYNLFAMGRQETGKHALVRAILERRAAGEPVPDDLCYVENFASSHHPRLLRLPSGRGREFRRDVAKLVAELNSALPAAFDTDEFRARKEHIEKELHEQHERRFEALRARAAERGIAVVRTPGGIVLAPLRAGEAITRDEFDKLPTDERKSLKQVMESLQESLAALIEQVPRVEKEIREKVQALVHEVADAAVGHLVDEVVKRYQDFPEVVAYLGAFRKDVLENVDDFLKLEGPSEGGLAMLSGLPKLRRYGVNLLVDHGDTKGAPVVYEDHPTYQNLIGRVEYMAQLGALLTDFQLVKAGALHRANGGYLVLDARNLLLQPFAWEGLKRALLSREVRIESVGQLLALTSTVSLEPEAAPLKVKVILIGERELYYLLDRFDPEFPTLFKVVADFEDDMRATKESSREYAKVIARVAAKEGLRPFDRGAVMRVMEHGARLAGDAERLTMHLGQLRDLLREAAHWGTERGAAVVERADVQKAVDGQERRSSRIRERLIDETTRGTLLVSTSGARIGQVNGLSVLQHGRFAFGHPNRITAKVRLGKGEVIDIEREVELGGPIHSKGVLILSGFVGARYATHHPLSLSASLVFEQSYGLVEGDSASCAELCALLSVLADAPIDQSFAVTGSVNQHGEVQAVGGVNEKIEGFFDVCRAKGLSGAQGVLLPASNVKNLVLRNDVVQAVREGRFRVVPIDNVDQAMQLLTGVPAGERDGSGEFETGSINARVEARLVALAKRRLELTSSEKPTES